eukprot:1146538-Lingulodinium_polyedra.AAC.1
MLANNTNASRNAKDLALAGWKLRGSRRASRRTTLMRPLRAGPAISPGGRMSSAATPAGAKM